jgi:hypothetical protein
MNDFNRLTKMLGEAQEALEMLAGGEAGLLDNGTTASDIAELVEAVQDMASFLEHEIGTYIGKRRLENFTAVEVEDTVQGWLDEADAVDTRRGEVA